MALGDLEQVVLFALVKLGGIGHGAAVSVEIEESTGRKVAPGALYTVLQRMVEKGYVEGWIGDSTPERGGNRRKKYRVLPEGARELQQWYAGIQEVARGTAERLEALAAGEGM
ncbi:MAG: PadR family transcriptional regulator [Phycisphaerales bacterium]|nr:PadR family transcriptional regulator [Phycisphaerales bacterium]